MLSDIADGIEVTAEQRDRGIATIDTTTRCLEEGLTAYEERLPCSAARAADLVEAYAGGDSVAAAARTADVVPVTAAKTLHLLGAEGISPLPPEQRRTIRAWHRGELTQSAARRRTGAGEVEFAIASYVEAHDPIDGARDLVVAALQERGDASVEKRDRLEETMSGIDDLL